MPAYNVEPYLKECIDSILAQDTEYSFHVIVVDDGSTDKTGEIADSFAADPKIRVIHQENQGLSGARNTGLREINAKYLMFVDSDDRLAPNAIQSLMRPALQYDADIVQGGFYSLFENKLTVRVKYKKFEFVKAEGHCQGFAWGKAIRSELFEKTRFPEGLLFEDSIFSFIVHPASSKSILIPEVVYEYRVNPNSITRTAPSQKRAIETYWITELLMKEHHIRQIPDDETYYKKIMGQIAMNCRRMKMQPMDIQKCAFVLTADLFEGTFDLRQSLPKYRELERALRDRDFGRYRLYCLTH